MRDVKRIVFSVAFAVLCHLALAAAAFGGVPCDAQAGKMQQQQKCDCLNGGFCPCSPECTCRQAATLVALHAEEVKSGPPPAAVQAPPQQTFHYEQRCNGRSCVYVLVPDSPPPAGPAAACAPAACAGCSTMTTSACYQTAEPPRAGRAFGRRLFHPFGGRFRGGCRGCG